ncbi:MAG: Vms1/Ankzf1 family peptidyl-tRNA hydrolase [Acidobacteriota bacterium]
MIRRQEIREILDRELGGKARYLSLYLSVDQSLAVNLNRGFEKAFKALVREVEESLPEEEKKKFAAAVNRVGRFLEEYEPRGKTLVFFADGNSDWQWHRNFDVDLPVALWWGSRPYVRPLVEARDEFARTAVVLADRAHARIFTLFLGRLDEQAGIVAEEDVHRFDKSGMDHLRSQMNFQRKQDEHVRHHLKRVAEELERLIQSDNFDRIVLGGPQEVTAELRDLLPDSLRRLVVGTVTVYVDAPARQIQEKVEAFLQEVERRSEEEIVSRLVTAAAKNHQAIAGWQDTLAAAHEGRIHQLVYADGDRPAGRQCPLCRRVFLDESECPDCLVPTTELADLLNAVVVDVLTSGGEIEQVRGPAAQTLKGTAGGIGAFLRF